MTEETAPTTETNNETTEPKNFRALEAEDGVHSFYGNVVALNWTLTDVRIRIGELIQITPEEPAVWNTLNPVVEERAAFTLPWLQAKKLKNELQELVESYEKLNGPIGPVILPPGT